MWPWTRPARPRVILPWSPSSSPSAEEIAALKPFVPLAPIQPDCPVDAPALRALIKESVMSDVTSLEKGQLTLQQFISKVAGEFTASPIMKMLAPLLLSMMQVELASVLKSPTAAQLIVQDIQTVMAGGTPAIATQAETGAVALISGLTSGETLPQAEQSALNAAAA